MATGINTTAILADSIPVILDSARSVREYEGVIANTVDRRTLPNNTGTSWDEVTLSKLTAQAVSENTELNNPQLLADALFSVTPTMVGIHTIITQRVKERIFSGTLAEIGVLAQNAVSRKKDQDGITVLDSATYSLGGAGASLTSGIISAAVVSIQGNTVEGASGEVFVVLHPFQIHDLFTEVVSVGTYPVPEGMSARVYQTGFTGINVNGAMVMRDGNIPIDTSADAKGGVYAREAIVLVQGFSPRSEPERFPRLGGGADGIVFYDEYAYGLRNAEWIYEIYTDATKPTS